MVSSKWLEKTVSINSKLLKRFFIPIRGTSEKLSLERSEKNLNEMTLYARPPIMEYNILLMGHRMIKIRIAMWGTKHLLHVRAVVTMMRGKRLDPTFLRMTDSNHSLFTTHHSLFATHLKNCKLNVPLTFAAGVLSTSPLAKKV